MRGSSSFLWQDSCPGESSVVSNGYEGPVEGGGGGGGAVQDVRDERWDCSCLAQTGTGSE